MITLVDENYVVPEGTVCGWSQEIRMGDTVNFSLNGLWARGVVYGVNLHHVGIRTRDGREYTLPASDCKLVTP